MLPDLRIAVTIISYGAPATLTSVLTTLSRQIDGTAEIAIVVAGGEARRAAVLRRVPAGVPARLLVPTRRLGVGEARRFALARTSASHVAFLDDDCVPEVGWWAALGEAIAADPDAGLLFGPRDEAALGEVGSRIRRVDRFFSKKNGLGRGAGDPVAVLDRSGVLVAGGNMCVATGPARRLGIFRDDFIDRPFEDVDFQLRLGRAGARILFLPRMRVRHTHPMTLGECWGRWVRGGQGLAVLARTHGYRSIRQTRWRIEFLVAQALLGWAALACVILCPALVLLLRRILEWRDASPPGGVSLLSLTVWLALMPLRNAAMVSGFVTEAHTGLAADFLLPTAAHADSIQPTTDRREHETERAHQSQPERRHERRSGRAADRKVAVRRRASPDHGRRGIVRRFEQHVTGGGFVAWPSDEPTPLEGASR